MLIKEIEKIINSTTFVMPISKTGSNLLANAILDRIEELGFEIVEKEKNIEPC